MAKEAVSFIIHTRFNNEKVSEGHVAGKNFPPELAKIIFKNDDSPQPSVQC